MHFVKRLSIGLIAGLMLSSVSPSAPASAGRTLFSSRTSWSCWRYKASEKSFAEKMNLARNLNGRSQMYLDKHLSRVARRHAWVMAQDNDLFHSDMGVLSRRVTRWRTLGENVGMGYSVGQLHTAFMASPGHRANIMASDFRHMGVGTVEKHGTLFVTVVFEGARDPGTTMSPPRCRR
jgi:uncharacterized protein YkwD